MSNLTILSKLLRIIRQFGKKSHFGKWLLEYEKNDDNNFKIVVKPYDRLFWVLIRRPTVGNVRGWIKAIERRDDTLSLTVQTESKLVLVKFPLSYLRTARIFSQKSTLYLRVDPKPQTTPLTKGVPPHEAARYAL